MYMMADHSCGTIPTAVITESIEKTTSSSRIWMSTAASETVPAPPPCPSSPSSRSWISKVAFPTKNRPPIIRMMPLPVISVWKIEKSGVLRVMIHEIEKSSRMREISASASPP